MSEPRCRVCAHPERADIEAQMVAGLSNVAAAERWGMSKDSVRRHRDTHLSPSLRAVAEQRETAGAVRAVDRAEAILSAAQSDGNASLSLAALRELRGIVELLARLSGELDERPQVNVLNVSGSAEWGQLRGVILAALRPFPEASLAVAGAIERGSAGV